MNKQKESNVFLCFLLMLPAVFCVVIVKAQQAKKEVRHLLKPSLVEIIKTQKQPEEFDCVLALSDPSMPGVDSKALKKIINTKSSQRKIPAFNPFQQGVAIFRATYNSHSGWQLFWPTPRQESPREWFRKKLEQDRDQQNNPWGLMLPQRRPSLLRPCAFGPCNSNNFNRIP